MKLSEEVKDIIRTHNKCEFKTVLLSDVEILLPKIEALEKRLAKSEEKRNLLLDNLTNLQARLEARDDKRKNI